VSTCSDICHELNQTGSRHTITLGHETLVRLKEKGTFGESYTELVSRLLDQLERINDSQGELKIA
jgi:hypothetical protein